MTDNQNTCQCCGKEYSRSETIRIFGDVWWTPFYCSAQCYTKQAQEKVADEKPEFLGGPDFELHIGINDMAKVERMINGLTLLATRIIEVINIVMEDRETGHTQYDYLIDQKNNIGSMVQEVTDRQDEIANEVYESTPYKTPYDLKTEIVRAHNALIEDTK